MNALKCAVFTRFFALNFGRVFTRYFSFFVCLGTHNVLVVFSPLEVDLCPLTFKL